MRLSELPRFPLANLPTPLEEAPRLSTALGGVRVLVKRDDLTGLALGGNKTRKLEFLLGDALARGATVMLTEGPVQSNHCRQTAAAAARAGLQCILVLSSPVDRPPVQGNLLLDALLGAEVHLVRDRAERAARLMQLAQACVERGERPYVVPTGGSTPLGVAAYIHATLELVHQLTERNQRPTHLFVASSTSGGTHAGLALGAKLLGEPFRVVGVAVEHDGEAIRHRVVNLANEAADLFGLPVRLDPEDVTVEDRWIGPDYGVPDAATIEAMLLAARTEGLVLDPVYTGKAMAALVGYARTGALQPGETVVFVHTGGTPAIFAQAGELASAIEVRDARAR